MSTLVDVHAHFLTERYVAEATAAGHARPDGMPRWPQWRPERQLRLMDAVGCDVAVLSISSPGVHLGDDAAAAALAAHVNDHAAGLAAGHGGRFRFLASLPLPDVAGAVREVRRIGPAPGLAGVVLLSHAGGRYLGDPALDPLWAELDALGAVTLVHPTSPPGSVPGGRPAPVAEFMFETARTALSLLDARVAERHPGIRFVLPHCGGALPGLVDRAQLFRLDGDAPETVAAQLGRLWFDCAGTPLPVQLPALLTHVREERVLYGSDSCWTPAAAVALHAGALDAGHPGWRGTFAANAARILGDTSRPAPATLPTRVRGAAARRLFRAAAERLLLGQR